MRWFVRTTLGLTIDLRRRVPIDTVVRWSWASVFWAIVLWASMIFTQGVHAAVSFDAPSSCVLERETMMQALGQQTLQAHVQVTQPQAWLRWFGRATVNDAADALTLPVLAALHLDQPLAFDTIIHLGERVPLAIYLVDVDFAVQSAQRWRDYVQARAWRESSHVVWGPSTTCYAFDRLRQSEPWSRWQCCAGNQSESTSLPRTERWPWYASPAVFAQLQGPAFNRLLQRWSTWLNSEHPRATKSPAVEVFSAPAWDMVCQPDPTQAKWITCLVRPPSQAMWIDSSLVQLAQRFEAQGLSASSWSRWQAIHREGLGPWQNLPDEQHLVFWRDDQRAVIQPQRYATRSSAKEPHQKTGAVISGLPLQIESGAKERRAAPSEQEMLHWWQASEWSTFVITQWSAAAPDADAWWVLNGAIELGDQDLDLFAWWSTAAIRCHAHPHARVRLYYRAAAPASTRLPLLVEFAFDRQQLTQALAMRTCDGML